MARLSTYPIISTPTLNDLLIGTDVENLNNTKNFELSAIGNLIGEAYVPYVGATGNVNLGAFNIEAAAFIIPGGLASEFVKADGSLDSTAYTPQSRTLTINGVTYNLTANRTWSLNTLDSLTTVGTGGAATYSGNVLNIPIYQSQGNYITQLSGEATAAGPGNASVTLSNAAVIAKVLTGLNITGGTILSTDSIITAFGKVQNQINGLMVGVQYQGTWNAATNTPTLTSSVGVKGYYYVVDVQGNTNLNGISDWKVGDWAIFNGSVWEKVDNTDAVVSVNGYIGAVVLTYSDVGAPPATRTLTINGTGYDLSADRSWTVGDVRTDQSYANPAWITSLAWSKITGTPTTLAGYGITDAVEDTTTLTINGTSYDLSANRTWNVGTITSIATSGPLTGGPITTSGTIGITQAGSTSDGYLSSTDWNNFNSKLNSLSATAPITLVADVIGITQSGAASNGYLSSTDWNIFNNKQDALVNPVTGTGTAYTLPMWSGATTLTNSPLSYAADTFTFQYNTATGGVVTFANSNGTPYAYTITMNNFGSPRVTQHSYTDGVVTQVIGGVQVSKIFANGNTIIGDGINDTGYKLTIEGDLFVDSITNATTDTDKFLVSDSGLVKYRTGSEVLSDIGAVPTTRQLTINGTAYDLSADRSWSVGTVTSVDMSVPAGFAIAGNPITGAGTLALTFAAGYSLPTNATQATWTTAYNDSIISASVTGTTTKTLTLNQQDGGTIQVSWSDFDTAPVTSVFGRTGDVIAQSGDYTTTLVTEGTNLYYTDARARAAISSSATGLTYTTATGVLSFTAGYSIPTNASQLTWDTAYNDSITSAAVTGTTTKTLTLNQQDGGTITASWSDYDTAPVTSVFGRTGAVVAQAGDYTTTLVTEGTNLYYTDARARLALSLTTTGSSGAATYDNTTGVFNIPNYGSALTGYVPYTGATTNVNLGEFGISAGYFQADLSPTQATGVGRLVWDTNEGTLNLGLLGGAVSLHIGEQQYARVVNGTGGNVLRSNYQVVKIIGAQGQRMQVGLARADNDANSKDSLGLIAENINNNNEGFVISSGLLEEINTTGSLQGETWADGDTLYLSGTTFGRLTNVKPIAPIHTVIIGFVVYSHANHGKIFVKVDNGYELEELHDVNPLPYVNNGVLYRDTSVGLWKSATIATLLGYTPASQAITLTINGTSYDLSANRTWSVGTVTSVNMSVPTGFAIANNPITTSGTLALTFDTGYSLPTTASQANWDTAYNNRITSLTTTGTSGAATLTSHVLNIPQYQAQGNYITSLTGEATASGPGAASVTLTNSAVIGKVLTGLNITGGSILATDTILSAFGKLQNQINATSGGLLYQGVWNANTNTPTLTSSVGVQGYFYIVNVAGTTNLNGITDWQVGDWALFDGTVWQKVDNTDSVTSVNGFTGAVNLTTSNISEGTNLYFTNLRSRQALSLTTTGSSGAATYDNSTGIFNIPQYTLSGLGGVPDTRTLTINGTSYDLSANRSWSVGTVTSIATTGPITGGTITGTGTIGITQSGASTDGYLSSTDWNTFNSKQNAFTGTTGYIAKFTSASNIGNSVLFESSSAIGLGTASIDATALFQMDSTTKGFLPPRMTQAQREAISAPAQGLVVYQTNGVIGLYIYSNSTWRTLGMI